MLIGYMTCCCGFSFTKAHATAKLLDRYLHLYSFEMTGPSVRTKPPGAYIMDKKRTYKKDQSRVNKVAKLFTSYFVIPLNNYVNNDAK